MLFCLYKNYQDQKEIYSDFENFMRENKLEFKRLDNKIV
jgi:hypothetical protein